ncbi:uncharacterized protein V6R79_003722 [Siganus canaliculatus]
MQKTNKKKRAQRASSSLTKAVHRLAVHTDRISHLAPTLRLEPSATVSFTNSTRGTHFIFGPAAGIAAVTALRLAQIETQAQIALQQLAILATITIGNQCHNSNSFSTALPPHLALSLLNRRRVAPVGFNVDSDSKTFRNTQLCLSATMYHHHSQQQGPQHFSNGPRPPHHQPPPNQHQNHPASDMMSQTMGLQFPRPTQLPDELESALSIRGARDMDHRLIDHLSRPSQHQNQSSGSGINQHGSYNSDNQPSHQQGVDWSGYQPPTKLFASHSQSINQHPQRHQGLQHQPQSTHTGTGIPNWTSAVSDSPSPQARHPRGGGDNQSLYTPESAGSILASFGLSNEDLEVLSHYPDDQLTPDTLPFILRDIQINKSSNQKTEAPTSSFSGTSRDMPQPPSCSSPMARSRSPEVPSLLTVTQTAGKVIDYGHASRAKDESNSRETFKREPLSSERIVKMYPSSQSSSSAPKVDKSERRQVRLEPTESSKHGDQDYRKITSDHHKSSRSPGREFPPAPKSRNLDRDYRRDGPKPRPSSETRSEAPARRSLSSSSGSKPQNSSKKLPTPTMISDFLAASPKVYPHTCSLCHIECDQEKDWVDHINTVNHTAACRDLRNKYPDWKPNVPSRSGRYGSRALWDPKDHSPSLSMSRSLSGSRTPSPPHGRPRMGPHHSRVHGRPYSPQRHPRYQHPPAGPSRSGLKRSHDKSDTSKHPASSKADHGPKQGSLQSSKTVKGGVKPGTKMTKAASAKAAETTGSTKPPLVKKKKKLVTSTPLDSSVANRLVYLTGIPKDASEQEVTDLVRSYGKINNVILMPCSQEENERGEGQKASVCMLKAEYAQALASSTTLSIRDQHITASMAKKPEAGTSEAKTSKPTSGEGKAATAAAPVSAASAAPSAAAGENSGADADQKTSDENCLVLITGLPDSGWSESDIIKLVQPFGTPCDIILATQIGKALVTVPDVETAREMEKVNAFSPMKINDCELKISHFRQSIGLGTPVALYNLLMGTMDPLESSNAPVGWSSLVVINNVPSTPSGPSEVQKLVQRFGTVIKTLVLHNMVICEMATAAMALSVYKRFQTFPCIIHNNPLFFSRKPDPKASTQTKVIAAFLTSPEETPANGQTAAAAGREETAQKKDSKSPPEGEKEASDGKEQNMNQEKTPGEDAALADKCEDTEAKEETTEEPSGAVAACPAAPHAEAEPEAETDVKEVSADGSVMEMAEEEKDLSAPRAANDDTNTPSSAGEAASQDTDVPQLPKVTQEMVNALLVECRTKTGSQAGSTPTSTDGEQGETQMQKGEGDSTAQETTEPAQNHTEEEELKERKDREARKEARERRLWEKEKAKKDRERDERARREREKREEERREWERRERTRRERKRSHEDAWPGSRPSGRPVGHKQGAWKDEQQHDSNADSRKEEEECDEFPFNLSDFVTVDEVGDVTELPGSPSTAAMEGTEEGEAAPISVQQDAPEDTPMEVGTEAGTSDASASVMKAEEQESEPVAAPTAETSNGSASPDGSLAAPASCSTPSQLETTCQPEAPEPEITEAATQDCTAETEPAPGPEAAPEAAPCAPPDSSCSPATGTAEREEEKENNDSAHSGMNKLEMSTPQEEERTETEAPAVESGKTPMPDVQSNTEQESVKKNVKAETPVNSDGTLPPFDPSNPVGMEFLVPKTGFFCKVCNRFFSGNKEAEINHCKTLKHYENLQKYMQTTKMDNSKPKPNSS